VLASTVILRSETRENHYHILLSQIRDSTNFEDQVPVFIPPVIRWPSYIPRYWVPFPSPFTTRRVTVEIIRTRLHTLESQTALTALLYFKPFQLGANSYRHTSPFCYCPSPAAASAVAPYHCFSSVTWWITISAISCSSLL
jgi:hypothetical protein